MFEARLSWNGNEYLLGKGGYWLVLRCDAVARFATREAAREALAAADASRNNSVRNSAELARIVEIG